MSDIHIVQVGESIWDVCLNATGALSNDAGPLGNLDAILEANDLEDWTAPLQAGQQIVIPDTVQKDLNIQRQLAIYPLSNAANTDILQQIDDIFDELAGTWILETGFWNGDGIWTADGIWKDAP